MRDNLLNILTVPGVLPEDSDQQDADHDHSSQLGGGGGGGIARAVRHCYVLKSMLALSLYRS